MPHSLSFDADNYWSSAKRQRSADATESPPDALQTDSGSRTTMGAKRSVKMPAYLQRSKSEITTMFNELEWKQRFRLLHAMENESSPYKVDRSALVVNRNRYGNVQPWDASRIKLRTPIGGSDYVNASPIMLKPGVPRNSDGTSEIAIEPIRYIATQGPKQDQKSHFWHMVHQEVNGSTGVIIMLTQMIEDSKEKCAQYYPTDLDDPEVVLCHEDSSGATDNADDAAEQPDIVVDVAQSKNKQPESSSVDTVTLLSVDYDVKTRCDVRTFRLVINGETKTILHYLFGRWPDFGKPEADDRRALIQLSKQTYAEAKGTPRIVHCSAGVGRTGTWIALDFLVREVEEGRLCESATTSEHHLANPINEGHDHDNMETWASSGPPKVNTPTLEDGNNRVDHDPIFDTVNTLREQRMMMVVREVQYSFLYDVVREAILQKYGDQAQGPLLRNTDSVEAESYPRKQPRIATVVHTGDSDAETDIIDNSQTSTRNDDDKIDGDDEDDPYSAVSPDVLRRGARTKRT